MRLETRMRKLRALVMLLVAFGVAFGDTASPENRDKSMGRVLRVTRPGDLRGTLDEFFPSGDVPRSIPDGPGGVAESVLEISNTETIHDLNVLVTITHSWIRDLRISLIAPDNSTEVLLLDLFPGDSAVNMTNCWFDDDASASIYEGVPPFTGVFRPLEPLDTLNDRTANGRWTLRVEDRFPVDTGRIEAWGIEINPVVNLQGMVRDAVSQTGISGVMVEVVELDRRTTSAADGAYGFSGIAAGTYTLRFSPSNTDFRSTLAPATIPDQDRGLMPVVVGFYDSLDINAVVVVAGQTTTQDAALPQASVVITDVDVTVNITHTWVGDLALILTNPEGTPDTLVRELAGGETCDSLGANLIGCRFDDEALRAYTSGTAPFTGSWRPHQALSVFNGSNPRGQWQLLAIDQCPGDAGRIENVTIHITAGEPQSADDRFRFSPGSVTFYGNFPNPFNAQTEFAFEVRVPAHVELTLFNLLGEQVGSLLQAPLNPGLHRIPFDAKSLASGLYLARLSADGFTQTRKVIVLR